MNVPVNFQQRLGDELAARAAALPPFSPVPVRPRHTRRIALTSVGLAAAVTAVVLGTQAGSGPAAPQAASVAPPTADGGSAPAFANVDYSVTVRPDKVVALKIVGTKLSGLQSALRRAGLPAVVLTPSATCDSKVTPVDSGHLGAAMSLDPENGRVALLDPGAIPHGDTLLIVDEAPGSALHKSVGSMAYMLTRPAPSCFPTSQVDIGTN
ncbi:hypothetical protein ACFPC0_13110 [Streptomyces andamanensis]|uniref:Uncharacterized protein n=1 Tax=Streptomyces andamanensis TaxID=1565035 RepID=A0ABV8TE43_9ACTN